MVNEIILKIKALFEGKGAEQAEQKLKDLGEASKSASVDVNKMGISIKDTSGRSVVDVNRMGSSFKGAAGLAGQMNAALAQGGPEAQKLAGGMRLLGGVINGLQGGIMGILTVVAGLAVSAFMKWRNSVAEAEKKLEEFRKKNLEAEAELRRVNFDKSIEEHGKLRAAIDAVVSAYSRQFSAQAALDNAEKGWRMAELTMLEKEAVNALDPDDDLGRAKVTADFAERRRNIDYEYQRKDAERKLEESIVTSDAAAKRAAVTFSELGEIERQIKEAEIVRGALTGERRVVSTQRENIGARDKRLEELDGNLKDINDEIKGLTDTARKLKQQWEADKGASNEKFALSQAMRTNLRTVETFQPGINAADAAAARRDIAQREDKAIDSAIADFNKSLAPDTPGEVIRVLQQAMDISNGNGTLSLDMMRSLIAIAQRNNGDLRRVQQEIRDLQSQNRYR